MISLVGVIADLDPVPRRQPLGRLRADRPVQLHAAVVKEARHLGTRKGDKFLGEMIDPLAEERRISGQLCGLGGAGHAASLAGGDGDCRVHEWNEMPRVSLQWALWLFDNMECAIGD